MRRCIDLRAINSGRVLPKLLTDNHNRGAGGRRKNPFSGPFTIPLEKAELFVECDSTNRLDYSNVIGCRDQHPGGAKMPGASFFEGAPRLLTHLLIDVIDK